MTPNDIVGMALLNGLDIIAVTDHNTLANVKSVIKAAQTLEKELIVLPGIEVSTVEEVHVICLFYDLKTALSFETELFPYYSTISNRVDIFGRQLLYDEKDRVIGEETRMLIAPTSVSFDKLYHLTHKYSGAFIPAHIDKESFSVLSNLGFLPPNLVINTLEVSRRGFESGFNKQNTKRFADKKMIFSSDAHQLWDISEKEHYLMLPERSAKAAIDFLR
jgi:hypothetical protein